jgi:hypothetical protein
MTFEKDQSSLLNFTNTSGVATIYIHYPHIALFFGYISPLLVDT